MQHRLGTMPVVNVIDSKECLVYRCLWLLEEG
jgi:hypothetical protein